MRINLVRNITAQAARGEHETRPASLPGLPLKARSAKPAGVVAKPCVLALAALLALLCGAAIRPLLAQAHPSPHARQDFRPGYLGVGLLDLDPDTAARLRLKDTRGALIFTIDRDAPAAAAGLRPRDVVLEVNGQRTDNVDSLRRKLREAPAGSNITLRISRDGSEQIITAQLGDQEEIAQRAWREHFSAAGIDTESVEPLNSAPEANFVPPSSAGGSHFLGHFTLRELYTGAELDPLSTQLADFFGVHDGAGLLVRTVNINSPASTAGLRAGDVILRVNNQPVVSRDDWTKQLHANRGRSMQLSVMRNRREQTMSLTAMNSKKGS